MIDASWIKALHVISVIAWMAGLLYLPRLFVYHADAEPGSVQAETFKVMEIRLLRIIITPAMIATWVFGIWAAISGGYHSDLWFQIKFALVLALTAFHMVLASWRKAFAVDGNTRPARFYRLANEIPTVLMIAIVILAVVRPF